MSYINPYYTKGSHFIDVPKEFQDSARIQIQKKLQLKSPPLRHGSSPLAKNVTAASSSSSSLDKLNNSNNNSSLNVSAVANIENSNINNNNNNGNFTVSALTRTNSHNSIKSNDTTNGSSKKKKLLGAFHKLKNENSSSDLYIDKHNNHSSSSFGKSYLLSRFKSNNDKSIAPLQQQQQQQQQQSPSQQQFTHGDVQQPQDDVIMIDDASAVPNIQHDNDDTVSMISSQASTITSSAYSNAENSLFSIMTNETNSTNVNSINLSMATPIITLPEALPTSFSDMYSQEVLVNTLPNGRPIFTKRELLDWEVNDLRSLLIVADLKPEWYNQVPIIYSPPGFRVIHLPLDSSNEFIIETLVYSDLYKERIKDDNFRYQIAKYTVMAARQRHEAMVKKESLPNATNIKDFGLAKFEWRNIIENFLLNLAIEAQCRHDLKKCVSSLKKQRKKAAINGRNSSPVMPVLKQSPPSPSSSSSKRDKSNSLLKKAIINGYTIYNNKNDETFLNMQKSKNNGDNYITKDEINLIWSQVQENVYKRIGLDWKPDAVSASH